MSDMWMTEESLTSRTAVHRWHLKVGTEDDDKVENTPPSFEVRVRRVP